MITDVEGIRVGHWTDAHALTGCTVILPPPETVGSVAITGGAPATRETDALAPGTLVGEVHAVVLTGGSAFGLAAADGVMRWLEERAIGFPAPAGPVPIVPAAAIYDLGIGDPSVRPGPAEGRAACDAATAGPTPEGNVGAGAGATVGKAAGPEHASKGGLGTAAAHEGGLVVAALAVVNAVGDVVDADGSVIAGARAEPLAGGLPAFGRPATTLACVATNAVLTKEQAYAVARQAATGFGAALRPAGTMYDGDAVFVLATRQVPSPLDAVGRLAAGVVAEAIRRGARTAETAGGVPARGHR